MNKVCTRCKEAKPTAEFYRCKRSRNGLQSGCKGCNRVANAKYYKNNKEKILERKKAYDTKKYYKNNKEKIAEYRKKNKEKINATKLKYQKTKCCTDLMFKLKHNLRNLIGSAFKNKGLKKNTKTEKILSCSFEDFKVHIEKQFVEGMNWENRNLWHIDHIMPVNLGKTEEEIIKLNHYTNLRPLWAEENLKKGSKF